MSHALGKMQQRS